MAPRLGSAVVVGWLVFGWSCFCYLAVDTLSAGVLGGQPGVPFASIYRSDPDRMLSFALSAQGINKNRGLPVLAEAALVERQAALAGDDEELYKRALAAYERSIEIDRWNAPAWLGMARLVDSRPYLSEHQTVQRSPEGIVLASLEIDPLFVPGIDWLVTRYSETGRYRAAYDVVRRQAFPWLDRLGAVNPEAAVRYFRFLEANAGRFNDTEVTRGLERLRRGEA